MSPHHAAEVGATLRLGRKFEAMVTRFHSPRTLSIPRSRNWRNPSTDLIMPNTGSGVCLCKARVSCPRAS
jgi:hypothetical protein